MKLSLALAVFLTFPSLTKADNPIWTLRKAICVHIYPEYQEEWNVKMSTYLPPFTEMDIKSFMYILDHKVGYLRLCTEESA